MLEEESKNWELVRSKEDNSYYWLNTKTAQKFLEPPKWFYRLLNSRQRQAAGGGSASEEDAYENYDAIGEDEGEYDEEAQE